METKPSNDAPRRSWARTSILAIMGVGSTGGVVWLILSETPALGVVSLAVVVLIAAVLFVPQDEPWRRLVGLIESLRQADSKLHDVEQARPDSDDDPQGDDTSSPKEPAP